MKQIDILPLSDELSVLLENKPKAERLDDMDEFYNKLEIIHVKLGLAEAYYNKLLAEALAKFEEQHPDRWKQIKNSSTMSLKVIGGQISDVYYFYEAAVSLRTTIEKVFANTNTLISAMKVEVEQGLRRPENVNKQNSWKAKQQEIVKPY